LVEIQVQECLTEKESLWEFLYGESQITPPQALATSSMFSLKIDKKLKTSPMFIVLGSRSVKRALSIILTFVIFQRGSGALPVRAAMTVLKVSSAAHLL